MDKQKKKLRDVSYSFYSFILLSIIAFSYGGMTQYTYAFITGFVCLILAVYFGLLKEMIEIKKLLRRK
jgi:hypothetical protein